MPTLISDLEGNDLNLFGRTLYTVRGIIPDKDGEWDMVDVTPFESHYTWRDVEACKPPAHVVGSVVAGFRDLHAPCIDVDTQVMQQTITDAMSMRPHDLLLYKMVPRDRLIVAAGVLGQLMADMNLVYAWSVNQKGEAKYHFTESCRIHVMRSSTPGNHHLYINTGMSWDEYETLLGAMVETDLVGQGYFYFSQKRKQSDLRLPGVTKTTLKGRTSDTQIAKGRGDSIRAMGRELAGTVGTFEYTTTEPFGSYAALREQYFNDGVLRKVELD